jgi:thiamine biosynthesis protein ThiI
VEVVLVRVGELTVKRGWTRVEMERLLLRAAGEAAEECGGAKVVGEPGRVYAWGDVDCLKKALSRVFGVKSVSPAHVVKFSTTAEIAEAAARLWGDVVRGRRFAVRVHRVGSHSFTSRDVAAEVGATLVSAGGRVDLESPEVELYVEVRGGQGLPLYRGRRGPWGPSAWVRGQGACVGLRRHRLARGGVDDDEAGRPR